VEVWHVSDYINVVIAAATAGYLITTVVLIRLMARANGIAMAAAGQNAKLASEALVETRHSNELTRESLKLASENAAIALTSNRDRVADEESLATVPCLLTLITATEGHVRGGNMRLPECWSA